MPRPIEVSAPAFQARTHLKIERNIPLASQVATALREVIERDYSDGGQIPNENDLASEIGVSRGTVRQALAVLEREGFVVRRPGAGTYANLHVLQLKVRADLPHNIVELIQHAGYTPSISCAEHRRERASAEVAQALGLAQDAFVLAVKKVYLADGQPAVYVVDFVPEDLAREPYAEEELTQPIFDFLERHSRVRLKYLISEFVPRKADREIADRLGVELDEALLQCDETLFNSDNKPVMHSRVLYKNERFRFTVLRNYRW